MNLVAWNLNNGILYSDSIGLKGTVKIEKVLFKWHGSVEPNGKPDEMFCDASDIEDYIPLTGTFSRGCTGKGASIRGNLSKTDTSVTGSIAGRSGGQSLPTDSQLSADLPLNGRVCAPCCDRIRATWTVRAGIAGHQGGAETSILTGNARVSVFGNRVKTEGGVTVLALDAKGCADFRGIMGMRWLHLNAGTIASVVRFSVSFECNE